MSSGFLAVTNSDAIGPYVKCDIVWMRIYIEKALFICRKVIVYICCTHLVATLLELIFFFK
jgi:hypothetical protein